MKTVYYFDGDIDSESIGQMITNLERLIEQDYDEIDIYFTTYGGYNGVGMSFAHYLNSKRNVKFRLIIAAECHSCGILILLFTPLIDKMFLPTCNGMIHLSTVSVRTRDLYGGNNKEINIYDNQERFAFYNNDKENERLWNELYSHMGLSKEQQEVIQSGRNLYLTAKELEHHYNVFFDWYYYSSGAAERRVQEIDQQILDLKNEKSDILKEYHEAMGKPMLLEDKKH